MRVVHTVDQLRQITSDIRRSQRTIAIVPTMGNLHEGHLSLVREARQDDHFVISTIFVNPLQFDDPDDLDRYPRTLQKDAELLAAEHCDVLFAPSVTTMYPDGRQTQSIVHVPDVSEGLCGGSRLGHFDGVATVVTKLFNLVQPDVGYFGEKDFQQVAVIRKMIRDLCMPIELRRVKTCRADDGLALSSRNGYLSDEERATAPQLYRTLCQLADDLAAGKPFEIALDQAKTQLNQAPWRLDYLEIRNSHSLQPVSSIEAATSNEIVILTAAFLGKARLIDNIVVDLSASSTK